MNNLKFLYPTYYILNENQTNLFIQHETNEMIYKWEKKTSVSSTNKYVLIIQRRKLEEINSEENGRNVPLLPKYAHFFRVDYLHLNE